MTETKVPVLIGEAKVAGPDCLLFTVGLGSCVAIALWDAEARVGGLAHAMLPDPANGRRRTPEGRFATTAVPVLLRLMREAGALESRIRARLAGGASMFDTLLDQRGVRLGVRNVNAARHALLASGVIVEGEDVGGTHGRSVFLNTGDGRLVITSVAFPDVIL